MWGRMGQKLARLEPETLHPGPKVGALVDFSAPGLGEMITAMEIDASQEVAMPEGADGSEKCPKCGGEIQATAKLYLSLGRDGWVSEEIETLNVNEPHLYCENDHELVDLLDQDRYIGLVDGAVGMVASALADRRAVDEIRDRLDLVGWTADVMDEIARIVRGTGREVRDLPM